jgi:HEAT repeat protein
MLSTLLWALGTAVAADPVAAPPVAQTTIDELRGPLLDLLGAHEHAPGADELRALGPNVSAALVSIASDASVPPTRRARAVAALGHFPGPREREFLEARLREPDALLQRKAAWALATAYGDEALPALTPLLTHDDLQLRSATARAIGATRTPAARSALEQRLARETDPVAVGALEAALADVQKVEAP